MQGARSHRLHSVGLRAVWDAPEIVGEIPVQFKTLKSDWLWRRLRGQLWPRGTSGMGSQRSMNQRRSFIQISSLPTDPSHVGYSRHGHSESRSRVNPTSDAVLEVFSTLCTPRENEPQILHALGIFTTSGRPSSSIALVSPESSAAQKSLRNLRKAQ
jgi:hypothetical protein